MADETKPADTATAANDADKTETFSVSREEWDKTQATLKRLQAKERVESKAAEATPKAVEDDAEPKTQKETLAKMIADAKAEREELRKEREDSRKEKRIAGVLTAISKHAEVDPEAHDLLFDRLEQQYGAKMKMEGAKVLVTDELGEDREIGDVIGEFLKSPKGKFFKAQKAPGPNTRAGRGSSAAIPGQKSFMEMSREELAKLPMADLQRLAKEAHTSKS